MNLYNVWRQSIVRTTEKLQQIQEQEKKSFKLKGTYIFGLVDNPDPWTEVELSKLFEIGLYKMFEIDTKPRYKASVVISVVLSQIRMVCQMIAGAMTQGITNGFSSEMLRESVTEMVEMVGFPLSITEQQEWASIPDALVIAQSLRQPCHGTEIAEVGMFHRDYFLHTAFTWNGRKYSTSFFRYFRNIYNLSWTKLEGNHSEHRKPISSKMNGPTLHPALIPQYTPTILVSLSVILQTKKSLLASNKCFPEWLLKNCSTTPGKGGSCLRGSSGTTT